MKNSKISGSDWPSMIAFDQPMCQQQHTDKLDHILNMRPQQASLMPKMRFSRRSGENMKKVAPTDTVFLSARE